LLEWIEGKKRWPTKPFLLDRRMAKRYNPGGYWGVDICAFQLTCGPLRAFEIFHKGRKNMSESGESIEKTAGGRASAPDNLWLRLVIFAAILLVMNTWCVHHLGSKLTDFTAANAPLAIIAITGFISKMLSKSEAAQVNVGFRGFLMIFLRTPVLTVLAILVLATGSVVSSVTVLASGTGERLELRLGAEGGGTIEESEMKTLDGPNEVERFIIFTTPFGRSFYLTATGYQRYSFDLKPWAGKKIRVSRDLKIMPSLLIRVPVQFHQNLSQAQLVVETNSQTAAKVESFEDRGSVVIGRPLKVPDRFISRWERELSAQGITGAMADRYILRWQRPIYVESSEPLAPGQKFTARLIVSDTTRAELVTIVGEESLQDLVPTRSHQ
jgi:hypothetical protein